MTKKNAQLLENICEQRQCYRQVMEQHESLVGLHEELCTTAAQREAQGICCVFWVVWFWCGLGGVCACVVMSTRYWVVDHLCKIPHPQIYSATPTLPLPLYYHPLPTTRLPTTRLPTTHVRVLSRECEGV